MPPKRRRALSAKASEAAKSVKQTRNTRSKAGPTNTRLRLRVGGPRPAEPAEPIEPRVEVAATPQDEDPLDDEPPAEEINQQPVEEIDQQPTIETRPAITIRSTPPCSQPAASSQPAALSPPPVNALSYNVAWVLKFEEKVLDESSQPGEKGKDYTSDMFDPHMFRRHCEKLVDDYVAAQGYQCVIIKNKVLIYPLNSKRKPLVVDWKTFYATAWEKFVMQIAENHAREAKRGSRPTISIEIDVQYARRRDWQQSEPPQSAQMPPGSAQKSAKKRATTTTRMVADVEAKGPDSSNVCVLALHKRWKCNDGNCMAGRGGLASICYIQNSIHYRVPMRRIKEWADCIADNTATADKMPQGLLKYCGPAGRAMPKTAATSRSELAPPAWPGPTYAAPQQFPIYPYPFLPPNVPTAPREGVVAPVSSPPKSVDSDPDEVVENFFVYMIDKNPRQETNLQAAQELAAEEGATLAYLWEWSSPTSKITNKKFENIGDGLRRRIHSSIKPYIAYCERAYAHYARLEETGYLADNGANDNNDDDDDDEDELDRQLLSSGP